MTTETTEQRDLSFKPITREPKTLSAEQVDFYNANGYVAPFDVFTAPEAELNRAAFDDMLRQVMEANHKEGSYAINGYHTRSKTLYDIATDPRILDIIEDIVGPDIVCWGTHYFCKLPHDPKQVAWHQDASYWPLTPAETVTVWLAIDDADEENSAMMFLPKTHDRGHLPFDKPKRAAVLDQELTDIEQYGEPVFNVLKAGQISIHDDMLAHGSHANESDRRRCGLTLRFCPPSVVALVQRWSTNAILCRGSDSTGNWTYPAKPENDDVAGMKEKPAVIGAN